MSRSGQHSTGCARCYRVPKQQFIRNERPTLPALSPQSPTDDGPQSIADRRLRTSLQVSGKRLVLALVIAGLSDLVGFYASVIPPAVWALDLLTAVLLFVVLGWQWLLLPGLVMEAIPGVGVVPIWLLVVGAIALWGTVRPNRGWTNRRADTFDQANSDGNG